MSAKIASKSNNDTPVNYGLVENYMLQDGGM